MNSCYDDWVKKRLMPSDTVYSDLTYSITREDTSTVPVCPCCLSDGDFAISKVCTPGEHGVIWFLETSICKVCGHIWRSVLPSEKWYLQQLRIRDEIQSVHKVVFINDDVESYRRQRYRELFAYLDDRNLITKGHVECLDIGCGTGTGLHELLMQGYNVRGLEIDASRARYGQELGVRIDIGAWDALGSLGFNVNLILSIHSLEHFYSPFQFLTAAADIMDPDTLLYLEVPDSAFIKDYTDSLYMSHVNNFSLYSLRLLAERVPLDIVESGICNKIYSENTESIYLLLKKPSISGPNLVNSYNIYSNKEINPLEILKKISQYAPPCASNYKSAHDYPIKYLVPRINDLSITYRSQLANMKTVSQNQDGRSLVFSASDELMIFQ